MLLALMMAMVATGSDAPQGGVDLICEPSGAMLKVWAGAETAPERMLQARSEGSASFQVDLARWTVSVAPAEGSRTFDLLIGQEVEGSRSISKTTISCGDRAGETLKLRFKSGPNGLQVVPSA